MTKLTATLACILLLPFALCQDYSDINFREQWSEECPNIYPRVFVGFGPKGNDSAGKYEKEKTTHSFRECVALCCADDKCNVVFMYESSCFLIQCSSNEMCTPIYRPEPQFRDVSMVLVNPVPPERSWANFLQQEDLKDEASDVDPSYNGPHPCGLVDGTSCSENEVCEPLDPVSSRTRYGVCQCKAGFVRNATGFCGPYIDQVGKANVNKTLVVSVLSKTVQLPEDGVTLSAYTIPGERTGEHYVYNWKLLSQPEDTGGTSGTIKDGINGGTLKLSHLKEGLYTFKVAVTGTDAYGETTANVTVLPRKRINEPPVAVITPSAQTVKLPNTGAVLDGSTSHDDDEIVAWHWELQSGPIGYQAALEDSPTLQLNNLTAGNYTFKLTVEDSDHATNSSTANVTVVKVMDYPPEANAGQDVIVYLPRNYVTLNGNLSSDDKGIALWEWTKSPSDQDKAVDMQKTRTPYLELSNLEEGMYTFTLKITDDNGQSSSSDVHVFVKPPTNKPPVASAGPDLTVSLPRTWVMLDGSTSSDDVKLTTFSWRQLSGPTTALLTSPNSIKTNATLLTKGQYRFQLTVTDSNGNMDVDSTTVTVNQNENAAPKANAGGDKTLVMPISVVTLNGSSSYDDLAIAKWEWIRDDSSQALGQVIGNSDSTPILMLSGLVQGRYVFRLRVTDGQGLTDEDTVSINVKPDPTAKNLVELTLNVEGSALTVAQEKSLEAKLKLLLRDQPIRVRELHEEQGTGRAVLVFSVGDPPHELGGPEVVALLRGKLKQDSGLLELSVATVQTLVCQNNCSGHGVCDQASRACLCEAFWMQSALRKYFGDGESNCDWSILYVVIVVFVGGLVLAACTWGFVCLVRAACFRPRPRQRYSPIDDSDEGVIRASKSVMVSETDSDSDVLFNRRDKNGHNRRGKNGFLGRRVKT